ncbi:MAG: glycosyltransferase [Oscillospiraceae bacterium]|jgi:dolichyl-phosphate beta-glucosyltransferase|nr:glycosyltransferase [Oscillospiraceae bacterium]
MKISLVIPAFNESALIRETVTAAEAYLSREFEEYELLVVNDGSRDGTAEILAGLASETVKILGYPDNRGKGCAVKTGVLAAMGDIVFYTDADLAYGLDVLKTAAALFGDAETRLVAGSRKLPGGGYGEYPLIRRLASKCFSLVQYAVSGMLYDTQCGFKGFRAEEVRAIFSAVREDGFAFDFEVLSIAERRGAKIAQLPVTIVNHRSSDVRLLRDSIRMLRAIYAIRRRLKTGAER